jgi:hypothetical protein
MYKAIQVQTGEEIIILNPYWLKHIQLLRTMDRGDLLVCQGCRQPLRVKAGDVKRPHFAHKHLQACSYGTESPEILNARAVLYEWLLKQFGQKPGQVVTVEKQVEGCPLPRPVDCWVELASGSSAYWIVEAGIKLEPREAIRGAFERLGVHIHYVFLHAMLNEEMKELHSLLLTPTERAFMQVTPYDQVLAGPAEPGTSLHYLDAGRQILTTYRSLALFHRPNWFKGLKKTDALALVRASLSDGEFVHPGEEKQLNQHRQRANRLAEKRKSYQQREKDWEDRLTARKLNEPGSAWGAQREPADQPPAGPLPCVTCGQITTDYWSTFTDASGRRLCRCRECLDNENKG